MCYSDQYRTVSPVMPDKLHLVVFMTALHAIDADGIIFGVFTGQTAVGGIYNVTLHHIIHINKRHYITQGCTHIKPHILPFHTGRSRAWDRNCPPRWNRDTSPVGWRPPESAGCRTPCYLETKRWKMEQLPSITVIPSGLRAVSDYTTVFY